MSKAIIAMSGGVDSSVAAYLIKNEGHDCMGATMKLHEFKRDVSQSGELCGSAKDIEDARQVAKSLKIDFEVFDFTNDFEKEVIERFVNTYIEGGTPNPCVDCNRTLKFKKLMDKMYEFGYDYVVTGHYARIEKDEDTGRFLLKKGLDESKDQSYVLYQLTQEQLKHTLFPLGSFTKNHIREIAMKQGFVNATKHDSQDICFVPDGDYARFIENYSGRKFPEGDFVKTDGQVVGRHKGIIRYTIGQRRGLGLALPAPLYVCDKDVENNRVILGNNDELFKRELFATNMNWISIEKPKGPIRVSAKIRYKQKEAPAVVEQLDDGRTRVYFDQPQRGITRGQAVVLYDQDIVVGGGTIL